MASKRITFNALAKDLGFCCPAAFIAANRTVSSAVLAQRMGLHSDTVSHNRHAGSNCDRTGECLISSAPEHLQGLLARRINRSVK